MEERFGPCLFKNNTSQRKRCSHIKETLKNKFTSNLVVVTFSECLLNSNSHYVTHTTNYFLVPDYKWHDGHQAETFACGY